jgi:RND superfamily putative drug exporter
MFHYLGQFVRRAWFLILGGWVLLFVGTRLAAPPWNEVAQDREFAFLPENCPSRRAEKVFEKAFPNDHLASNIALVIYRTDGRPSDLDRERQFISDVVEPGLRTIADEEGGLASEAPPSEEPLFPGDEAPAAPPKPRSIIARIRTPNAPGAGTLLVSPDGQAMLVLVELTTEFLSTENWPITEKVQGLIQDIRQHGQMPPGVDIALTGSAVIGRDHTLARLQSAHATELLTVVLVIALLLLLYRAPLLAIIPLATVYLAIQVSVNTLALMAGAGWITLFQGIQIYITILAYGAGVDYCLFLIARFEEELDYGAEPAEAVANAIGGVGAALAASAATVICGIGMMMFAQFGKFREAGFAIPLGLILVLCATLTFSPSLLRLAGRWAFWPRRIGTATSAATARLFGFRTDLLHEIWEQVGRGLIRRPGAVWLGTAAVMAPFAILAGVLYGHLSYDLIGDLPESATSVAGTRVLREQFPAGITGPVTILLVNPDMNFGSPKGRAVVQQLTDGLRERKQELGLGDVRSLTAPLGITEAAAHPYIGVEVSDEARNGAMDRMAREFYLTDLGQRGNIGTRLEIILEQAPFSQQSVRSLGLIEQTIRTLIPEGVKESTQIYSLGIPASVRDLSAVMAQDRLRIEVLVLASVFVILVVLLHQFVIALYLLLSVLFSYYCTLGVAFVVFWMLDPTGFLGIDWKVAIFLFTILIAVGEDYNILLMTRVDEESQRHGSIRGVTEALSRTGPVISSCGIIMAGTFASLLGGSLTELKQLGFALAFGVLLDTFVVRPVLVPSFLILLRTGRLTPWRRGGADSSGPADPARSRASVA